MSMLVPLTLTTLAQQAYSFIAIAIASYLGGAKVLGTVQSISFPAECITMLGVALCTGFAVSIGNAYGQRDSDKVRTYAGTSLRLSVLAGIAVSFVSYLIAPLVISLMSVPSEVADNAVAYLRCISFAALFAYPANSLLATLRSTGSQSITLLIILLSGAFNAALDALMLSPGISAGTLGLGMAQVMTYALIFVLSWIRLMRRDESKADALCVPNRYLWNSFDDTVAKQMLATGIPLAATTAGFQITTCFVQADVNSYGLTVSSAYGIANRIDSISWSLASSMGMTMTVLTSQVLGEEEDKERALDTIEGIRKALWNINLLVLLPLVMLLILLSHSLGALLSGSEEIAQHVQSIFATIGCLMCVYAQGEVLAGVLKGSGDGRTPLLVNIIGIMGVRLLWIFLVSPYVHSAEFACLAMPVSWIATLGLALVAYRKWVEKFLGHKVIFYISSTPMQE